MNSELEHRRTSGLTVAAVVALLLVCALIFGLIFLFTARPTTDQQIAAIHANHPAYNLEQTTPSANAAVLSATQEVLLQGYAWVDQPAGIARIPIDRAMALMVTEQPEQTVSSQP